IQEAGLTVPKAAAECDIPRFTAYKFSDQWNVSDGTVLPGSKPRTGISRPKKLFAEHTEFLI
ncbi:hypothetical protein BDF20DRAFT_801895, partial [Mycotypha africana]|uniref:uncharacterized protein n=1 Tax=Mycotypha africana TaxID=64632 RepID=UPI0023000F25